MIKNATIYAGKNESKEDIVNYYYNKNESNEKSLSKIIRTIFKKIQYRLADIGLVPIVEQEYVVCDGYHQE